jgi:hypothetical protein
MYRRETKPRRTLLRLERAAVVGWSFFTSPLVADDGPFMPYGLTIQRFMFVTPPSYAFQALKCRFWAVIRPAGRASFGSSNEGLASPFLLSQSAANPTLEQFSTPLCTSSQFIPLDRTIPAFQCSPSLPSTIDGTCRGDMSVGLSFVARILIYTIKQCP